jgi:energy-coupling factor transporter ATP-binding protein EcfA2
MLSELIIQNFRCFDNHKVELRPLTIIVGRNNSGKSTIVEALRIVSLVTERYTNIQYKEPPIWADLPRYLLGITPSSNDLHIDFRTIFHRYGDPPGKLEAKFKNNSRVEVYIGPEGRLYAVVYDSAGKHCKSKHDALKLSLGKVSILPQIHPLLYAEKNLTDEYVRRMATSPLSSSHFRNNLRINFRSFKELNEMVQSTWPGLRLLSLEGRDELHIKESSLSLMVQDGDFVAEAAWMGSGLQMWLQTMWFLVQSKNSQTIILDEPDVYMHPDLQRKLIKTVSKSGQQLIITTHSVEIMSEVDPENILIIDRKRRKSDFATSVPAVQSIIDRIGSVQNVHLTRLWSAKKCILVEGKDIGYLNIFHQKIFPNSKESLNAIPNMSIGGWGGWPLALGSSLLAKNAFGEEVIVYCVLDRDYHTNDECTSRLNDAKAKGIELQIWNRKEIENYLIDPMAILSIIDSRRAKRTEPPTFELINEKLRKIIESLKDSIFGNIATSIQAQDRSLVAATVIKKAKERIDNAWSSIDGQIAISPGKSVISLISQWSQDEYGVSFGPIAIAHFIHPLEIDPEIVSFLTAVERGSKL